MRYLIGFVFVALGAMGCSETPNPCDPGTGGSGYGCQDALGVSLVPAIEVTYDVALVLDGEAGAHTCVRNDEAPAGWIWTPGAPFSAFCSGEEFTLHFDDGDARPESVEITVSAEDGSWNGSLTASPTYHSWQPNDPCPPTCYLASLTVTNDVGAFEVQP